MEIEVLKKFNVGDIKTNQIWTFTVIDHCIVFTGYRTEEKQPRQRKFRTVLFWNKYRGRESNIPEPEILEEHIKSEALENYMKTVKVKKWKEFKS